MPLLYTLLHEEELFLPSYKKTVYIYARYKEEVKLDHIKTCGVCFAYCSSIWRSLYDIILGSIVHKVQRACTVPELKLPLSYYIDYRL